MKRKTPDPPEGAADWVVSYGDIMSLLLTFFVLLFSFSTIDAEKWKQLVESMTGKPGISIHSEQQPFKPIKTSTESSRGKAKIIDAIVKRGDSIPLVEVGTEEPLDPDMEKLNDIGKDIDKKFDELYRTLLNSIVESGNQGDIEIFLNESSIVLRFKNKILFESGNADLDAEKANTITAMVVIISEYSEYLDKLIIEGNTDNIPIHTARYRDNFELSIYRALNVFYFIQKEDLFPAKKIEIKGYGENNPIESNATEEGRALNRRTDMVIIKMEVEK